MYNWREQLGVILELKAHLGMCHFRGDRWDLDSPNSRIHLIWWSCVSRKLSVIHSLKSYRYILVMPCSSYAGATVGTYLMFSTTSISFIDSSFWMNGNKRGGWGIGDLDSAGLNHIWPPCVQHCHLTLLVVRRLWWGNMDYYIVP